VVGVRLIFCAQVVVIFNISNKMVQKFPEIQRMSVSAWHQKFQESAFSETQCGKPMRALYVA